MYIIKQITVDDEVYISSKVVDCIKDELTSSMIVILEGHVKDLVKEEFGAQIASESKVIDINSFNQINEPKIDTILLYRLENEPSKIYVYQRRTKLVKTTSWTYSVVETTVSTFKRTHIFEIESAPNFFVNKGLDQLPIAPTPPPINTFKFLAIGPAGIKIPHQIAMTEMTNVLEELVANDKFKKLYELNNID